MLGKKSKFLTWVLLLMGVVAVQAQESSLDIRVKINSPYSRYGLGDMVEQYFAYNAGMGGLTTAYNDPYHLNPANPASLAFLKSTAFAVGGYGQYTQIESSQGNYDNGEGNMRYLSLGFPLKNQLNQVLDEKKSDWDFGSAISLVPISEVGYDFRSISTVESADTNNVVNQLKGTGGLNQVKWGVGAKYKNLAFGANFKYTFGNILNTRLVVWEGVPDAFYTEYQESINYQGVGVDLGVQYKHMFESPDKNGELKPNGKSITVGATFAPANTINSYTDRLHFREAAASFPGASTYNISTRDTFLHVNQVEGKTTLPSSFSVGAVYQQINKVRLGVDYTMTQWSNYKNESREESLLNTWRLNVGGEYIPQANSYNNYFKRMRYRAGFHMGTDAREINGEQLQSMGLTLGLGMPLILPRQKISFVNLAFEAGRFGVDNILQENYYKITVGFILNDNSWFFKRKFN